MAKQELNEKNVLRSYKLRKNKKESSRIRLKEALKRLMDYHCSSLLCLTVQAVLINGLEIADKTINKESEDDYD